MRDPHHQANKDKLRNRVEEKTIGGEMPNDNCSYETKDPSKFKYCKLVNIVKIYVYKSFDELCSLFRII
jgi:hypothetical protein